MRTIVVALLATGCGLTVEHTATGPDIRVAVEQRDGAGGYVDNTEGDTGTIGPDGTRGYAGELKPLPPPLVLPPAKK